jgi:hypothetical protein
MMCYVLKKWEHHNSGIPLELFVEPIIPTSKLVCKLCSNVVNCPLQCLNGHMFCKRCISNVLLNVNSFCPTCDIYIGDFMSMGLLANSYLNDLAVYCVNKTIKITHKKQPCSWIGKLADLDKHLEICECENILCLECGSEVDRDDARKTVCLIDNCCWVGCRDCKELTMHLAIHEKHDNDVLRIKRMVINVKSLERMISTSGDNGQPEECPENYFTVRMHCMKEMMWFATLLNTELFRLFDIANNNIIADFQFPHHSPMNLLAVQLNNVLVNIPVEYLHDGEVVALKTFTVIQMESLETMNDAITKITMWYDQLIHNKHLGCNLFDDDLQQSFRRDVACDDVATKRPRV